MDSKQLSDVPLFARLGKRGLNEVAGLADDVDIKAGEVMAREGEIGHEFFVIQSGRAEVTVNGERIRELGPDDFFGEIALIAEERRTATVTAVEPMTCIVMSGQAFRSLKRSAPEVYETVHAEVEKRLQANS